MKIRRFILLTFVFLMSASLVGCKEKTETEIISGNADKEEIIDKYFQAINDKDMIKIFTISYPNEALEVRGDGWKNWTADKTLAHYTRNLGFYRGLYEKEEFTTSVAIVAGSYPNGIRWKGHRKH